MFLYLVLPEYPKDLRFVGAHAYPYLAIPAWAPAILAAMAVGVALGIVQRWVNARRLIGER